MKKLTDFKKNEENPFLKQAIKQAEQNAVKKYKTAGSTDKKAILQNYDQKTGEILGHTQFIKQIEVDEEQFAKTYLLNFSAFFNLKPQAIKVFGYILNQLQPNQDEFIFIREDCMKFTKYTSQRSVFVGLASLLDNEIIARGRTDFLYFINPMVLLKGNQIAFAKTYVKKKRKQ